MKKFASLSLVFILFCSLASSAFSFDHHWGGHYRYRDGHYYSHAGWFGFGALATGLAVGAYVASLPPEHETVVVAGRPYYYYDGYYYESSPNGYVVVDPPAGQETPDQQPMGSSPMMYILGTLLAILLIAGIGVLVKRLFTREGKTA